VSECSSTVAAKIPVNPNSFDSVVQNPLSNLSPALECIPPAVWTFAWAGLILSLNLGKLENNS
jgi:hypothetical protein